MFQHLQARCMPHLPTPWTLDLRPAPFKVGAQLAKSGDHRRKRQEMAAAADPFDLILTSQKTPHR